MQPQATITTYHVKDFRSWLMKHHQSESRVALVIHKRHTGKPAPTHRELLEEAICFGWVDTTIKRIDEDTFLRHFAKRNLNSQWSSNTLSYARQLIKDKRMKPEGLRFYKLGLAKPTHDDGIPKNPDMPPELKKTLSKNKNAQKNFAAFPPSTKRMYYRWLLRAKQPETKKKRVNQIITAALANNKNVFQPQQKINT